MVTVQRTLHIAWWIAVCVGWWWGVTEPSLPRGAWTLLTAIAGSVTMLSVQALVGAAELSAAPHAETSQASHGRRPFRYRVWTASMGLIGAAIIFYVVLDLLGEDLFDSVWGPAILTGYVTVIGIVWLVGMAFMYVLGRLMGGPSR